MWRLLRCCSHNNSGRSTGNLRNCNPVVPAFEECPFPSLPVCLEGNSGSPEEKHPRPVFLSGENPADTDWATPDPPSVWLSGSSSSSPDSPETNESQLN